MLPKSVSRGGCWTCRIRHKKCDEARPECHECKSRTITCHGYGQKPHWIDNSAELHLEISRIKSIVKHNFRRNKRSQHGRTANSDSQRGTRSEVRESGILLHTAGSISARNEDVSQEIVFREAELTMYYMDCIFPILFPYCRWEHMNGGRGWLLWLLTQTVPLRQAALSLAALHQQASSALGGRHDETELLEYHTSALRGLRQALHHTSDTHLTNDADQLIHLMACGCSLISFEVSHANCCICETC